MGRHRSTRHRRFREQSQLSQLVEGLTVALLVATPVLLGTVQPWPVLVTSLLAVSVLGLELVRKIRRRGRTPVLTPLGVVLGVGLLWTFVQALPLPRGLVGLISPRAVEIRDYVLLGEVPASWIPISLDQAGTLLDAVRFAGLLALFLVALNRVAGQKRRTLRVFQVLVLTGAAVSAVGMIQKIFGVGLALGLAETPLTTSRHFTGTFVNPNHLAGYLGLLAPLGIGLALETRDRSRKILLVVSAVLIYLGAIFTLSRGGIVALAAGQVFLLGLLVRGRLQGRRGHALVPIVLGVVLTLAAWLAYEEVGRELATLEDPGEITAEAKIQAWAALWPMSQDFWAAGIGRGAFASVYPLYKTLEAKVTFTHAENEVLQALVECGWPVALAVVGVLLAALLGLALRPDASLLSHCALAGLFTCSLHNLVDFSLETGAVGCAYFVVLGVLVGRWQRRRWTSRGRLGRGGLRPAGGLAAVLGILLIGGTFGSWAAEHDIFADTAYLRKAVGHHGAEEVVRECLVVLARRPADYYPALVAAHALVETGAEPREALHWINRAQYLNPSAPGGHELAATVLRRMGLHSQAMIEWKLAAEVSGREQNEVLARAYRRYPNPAHWRRMTPAERGARLFLGRQLLARKQAAEALSVMEEWLEVAPDDVPVLMLAQRAAERLGQRALARQLLERAILAEPHRPGPFRALVKLAAAPADQRAALERGLSAIPGDPQMSRALFDLLLRAGEYERAEALADGLRRYAAGDSARLALAHGLRGKLEEARGNLFQGIRRYRQAVDVAPRTSRWRVALARLYVRTDQYALARAEYQALLSYQPNNSAWRRELQALETRGRELRDARRLEELQRDAAPGTD